MATDTSSAEQWIVRFKPFVSELHRSSHISSIRALTTDSSNPFNVQIDHEFSLPDVNGYVATFDEVTKAQLESLPGVYEIEQQQYFKKLDLQTQTGATWGLARLSNAGKLPSGTAYAYKYRNEASGEGVTAYVVDTGINDTHADFEGRAKKGPVFARVGTSINDTDGHGTHVAGTVGSKTYGVAKHVKIVGVKVFYDAPGESPGAATSDIIKALQWVYTDVNSTSPPKKAVVNLSLGGGVSAALDAAVASLVRQGIIVVAAAGNEQVPADYSSPGREPLAITVGATDINDNRADFSNWGRLVDVFAPGVNIKSTYIGGNHATAVVDGTSQASPHVAGLVANLLSDPSQNYHDYREAVQDLVGNAEEVVIGNLDLQVLKDLNPKYTTAALIAKNKV